MTIPIALSVISLVVSLFLVYRTELQRANMSLRLLAAPNSWTVSIARRGSSLQATDPAQADQLSMHGIFAVAVTNDGPRGGAVWDLAGEIHGIGESWRLDVFNPSQATPYALPGRSSEGWSRVVFIVACDFDRLASGLRELQEPGRVTFRISYACQNWRGRAHRRITSLRVTRASLLAALKQGVDARGLDLASCQVVPRARSLAAERYAGLDLTATDIGRLTEWALLKEPVEYITTPDEAPDRITIRRASGVVNQGWFVGVGRPRDALARICEIQSGLVREVREQREAAVQV